MSLYSTPRRILRSILAPLQNLCISRRTVKMFKGIKGMKCNAVSNQKPEVHFIKGNYRNICQASVPLDRLCVYPRIFPALHIKLSNVRITLKEWYPNDPGLEEKLKAPLSENIQETKLEKTSSAPSTSTRLPVTRKGKLVAANERDVDKNVNCGVAVLKARYSSYPSIAKKPTHPFVENWRLRAQAKDHTKPALSNGPSITAYRGRTGNLAAANGIVMDKRVKSGFAILITMHPGYQRMSKPITSYVGNWILYAQANEPGSPKSNVGVPVKASGGRLGKLDAADERGFFHKINMARLEQIKQMMKDKPVFKKKEDDKKKDP